MSLKYDEKVQISRQQEIEAYRQRIATKLDESKRLANGYDSLVKLRALEMRIDKLSKPRPTLKSEELNKYKRKKYQENKETRNEKLQQKREKIRQIGKTDIGKFLAGVPV